MKRPIFADGILKKQIEHRPWGQPKLAVSMHHGARAGLVVGLDSFLENMV